MLERAADPQSLLVAIAISTWACSSAPSHTKTSAGDARHASSGLDAGSGGSSHGASMAGHADAGTSARDGAVLPSSDASSVHDGSLLSMDAALSGDARADAAQSNADDAAVPCIASACDAEVTRRAASIVARHAAQPWPAKGTCWGDVTWSFAALYTNGDLAGANAALVALPTTYNLTTDPKVEDDCYWAHSLIARILLLPQTASRVSDDARSALLGLMWSYIQKRSLLAEAAGSIWMVSGSENHDAMRKSSYLLFEQVLESAGRGGDMLDDGHSVSEHHAQWTTWWKEYFRQRAREGISCEIASPTYALYGIQCFANLRDFSDSNVLRGLAESFETLFWADYAQDFLPTTGVRAGGMTRVYKDQSLTLGTYENLRATTWMYGWHESSPQATNPATLIMATSSYRPPAIVSSMAIQPVSQAYVSRHFGLGMQVQDPQGIAYKMTFPNGGASIRREGWRTPAYAMGTFGIDLSLSYTALNGQDRAMGVMFASDVNHRIMIAGNGTDQNGRRGMAEIHGVSGKDCLVVARDTHATQSSGTRIFVSSGQPWDNRVQVGGWLFTLAGSGYAAIRVATGNWTETAVTGGTMLDLSDMWAPIAIQTGSVEDYASFGDFQESVMDNAWEYANGRLSYISEAGNTFEVWSQSTNTPKLDGAPLELNPTLTYDSAYLHGVHGEDAITLRFPGMQDEVLDFSY